VGVNLAKVSEPKVTHFERQDPYTITYNEGYNNKKKHWIP